MTAPIKVCIIAALGQNRCIGMKNQIPWHIPEDFAHFKALTMGKPMIMGRKTFESLPGILPGRPHIVVSHSGLAPRGVQGVQSLDSAIRLAADIAKNEGQEEIFIIGGAQIYKAALEQNRVHRMNLTYVDQAPDGDAFFPEFNPADWTETSCERHEGFRFMTLERKT